MTALLFGLFGLLVGSFLNVVILRHGVRSIGGRSGCMTCGMQLRWYDMVPVVSWLALLGRCRTCRARISIQYPLVEATTGILFGLVGYSVDSAALAWSGGVLILVYLCIAALLVCIAAYDMLHTIIPDKWAYSFAGLAFISQFLALSSGEFNLWWHILAGPVAAAPLFALWLFSRGRWMGLGDVKLALGIGWLLGAGPGIFAVFGAFVIGAAVSLPLLVVSSVWWQKLTVAFTPYHFLHSILNVKSGKGYTMKSEIPFGPFLICSCIIIWFASIYGIDTLQVFELLPLTTF